jgi:hypothetical protein
LYEDSAEAFRWGMACLEEEEEPDSPAPPPEESISKEQFLMGQAQALGAFGIANWEFNGVVPYGLASLASFDPNAFLSGGSSASQGSSSKTLLVS